MRTILYLQTVDWYHLLQRPQQLFKQFARKNYQSIFINNPAHFKQKPGIVNLEKNLYLVNPPIDKDDLKFKDEPILFVSYPPQFSLCQKVKKKLLIFDSIDGPEDEFSHWKQGISYFQQNADIIFCTAKKLYDEHVKIHLNVHIAPNGADYDHFSKAQIPFIKRPHDIEHINMPIVLYYGALATWVDFDLIYYLASRNRDFMFVLIGSLFTADVKKKLKKYSNVIWLGHKDYEVLPQYLSHAKCCIIPFKVTEMIKSCNPIKLWEYLSSGKPIITTDMPEVLPYKDLIYVSHNHKKFHKNLNKAMEENDENLRKARIELAKKNSWSNIADNMIKIIEETIEKKEAKSN